MEDTGKLSIRVGLAEYAVSSYPAIMKTNGIGSCLAIILHDNENEISALLHAMQPYKGIKTPNKPAKYIDFGVNKAILDIENIGGDSDNITAKIVGANEMFELNHQSMTPGEKNIRSFRKVAKENDIPIKKELTGGTTGKNVQLDSVTGKVTITTSDGDEIVL